MAQIKAFKALRFTPKAGTPAELFCPPYDIISETQRKGYLSCNPNNIIRLELPKEGENPYATAATVLHQWIEQGILAKDTAPGIYIYEEEFTALGQTHKVKGVQLLVRLTPFAEGVVLPHEETLSKAKEDRLNLMKACGCNFSPIYSLYFDAKNTIRQRIDALSAGAPTQQVTLEDGIIHRLWCVYDPAAIAELTALFADKKLYIADGHHRYETALNYKNHLAQQGQSQPGADFVMMLLVNMEHEGLVVFPTHRIVKGLADFSMSKLLDSCKASFRAQPIASAQAQPLLDAAYAAGDCAFVVQDKASCYLLTLTDTEIMAKLCPNRSAAYHGLDVAVLHSLVLEKALGIDKENMANGLNLRYTRSLEEAQEALESGEANCIALLNPTKVSQIADVAGAGDKMPQKSTYFYPKIITGAVMNKLLD